PVSRMRALLTIAWMTRSETPAVLSATSESASVVNSVGCASMDWTMRSSERPAFESLMTESLVIFAEAAFGVGSGPAVSSWAWRSEEASRAQNRSADRRRAKRRRIGTGFLWRAQDAQPSYRTNEQRRGLR